MASFNTIDCASYAYQLVWRERQYLLKLALVPLVIKLAFFMVSLMYGESGNVIRMSLLLIPAYFAEGWMLCHFVRLMTNGQRWPYVMTGDDAKDLKAAKERGRPLLAGILGFVLINLSIALYFHVFSNLMPAEMLEGEVMNPEDVPPGMFLNMTLMMAFVFLAFRFVWLYVPLAARMRPLEYIRKTNGVGISARMIGLWLICFVPAMVTMQFILSLFMVDGMQGTMIAEVFVAIIRIIFDTVKNILVTAGMTVAILHVMNGKK
ncbi:MAG: hypothetical protein HRT94_05365 [Alphaproteobacteria bacterium]|nr:hypothetical protein [Alphaproteobacteria bacterium]